MQSISYRYRKQCKAFRPLAGLFTILALCGTHSALSQQSKASLPIGKDLRNGAGSNLAKAPVNNSRTPMEVTNGVATVIGHYPESSKLRIVIGLTPPKMAEEEEFLKELQDQKSPNFHKWLTPEQWNTRFAPAPEDEQAVADWAKSQGLTVTQRYPNRLIVDVEGTSGSIEKAFGVTINNYLLKGVTEFSNDRDPVIPASLGSIIQSVGGLNSVQRAHAQHEGNAAQLFKSYAEGDVVSTGTSIKHDGDHAAFEAALKASDAKKGSSTKLKSAAQNGPVDPSVTDGLIDPTDIYSSYGYSFGALQNLGHCCGSGHPANTSIAVATAYGVAGSDLDGFHSRYTYLAEYVQPIYIDGTPSCCNDETTLDTEWSLATANSFGSSGNTSEVYVYEGVNSLLSTFTDIYNVILNRNETRVFTTSWGCQEFSCSDSGTMSTDHAIFNSMIGQGWTLMAATGDQGAAAGCGDANAIQYPSSDPDIVAVGGTTLSLYSDGSLYSETGWQGSTFSGACSSNNGGSTGGCSGEFAAPGYQTNPFCGSGSRSVPDISLNAGAGQNTYYNGAWYGFGGTSIASPMVAGFFAQANSYLTALGSSFTTIGQGNPEIYYMANNPTYPSHDPFYDMTSGCNNNDITAEYGLGYYCAVSGYDRVTGWGSFNALQMSWAMNSYFLGDFVAPTVAFSGPFSGGNGNDHWYNTDQTVSWTVSDTGEDGLASTGVAGYSAGWDTSFYDPNSEANGGDPNSFYNGPEFANSTSGSLDLASAGQGCHYATVDAWDNSGYTSGNEFYYYLCYDTVAPVTTATLSGTLNGSVYTTSVKVTLSATDATSGVASTLYSVDGGALTTYGGAFTVSGLGNHTVSYHSKDVAGNVESVKTTSFTISTTTTTKIASSVNPSTYGQGVTFTATVTPGSGAAASGTVTFLHNSTALGTATLAGGVAKLILTDLGVGTEHITATYNGSSNDISSTSSAVAQVINQASTTTKIVSSSNPSSYNAPITLTATVTSSFGGKATGTVKFYHNSTVVGTGTLAGNVATVTLTGLGVGTEHFTATYGGDGNNTTSTSSALAQVINMASTTTTLTSSSNPSTYGEPVTLTAKVTPKFGGTVSGTVTFYHNSTVVGTGTVSGGVATLTLSGLGVGTEHFTATYGGSSTLLTSTSSALSQVIDKASTTTTVSSSSNPSTHGSSVTFTAAVTVGSGSTATGTVTFKDGSTTLGTGTVNGSGDATYSTKALASGTHSITAVYGGSTDDSSSTSHTLSQKVN